MWTKKQNIYEPEDKAIAYLSVWRLRMAPMLGTLAGLRTLGTWGIWERGVTGAVGVVGVWGKLGGRDRREVLWHGDAGDEIQL